MTFDERYKAEGFESQSAQPWSPEPWAVIKDEGLWGIHACRWPVAIDFSKADADRAVACVNALAGISDPAALVATFNALKSHIQGMRHFAQGDKQIDWASAYRKEAEMLWNVIDRAEAARK